MIHFEQNELIALMYRLWEKEEREYQYLVLDLLKHATVTIIRSSGHDKLFKLLKHIIITKSDFDIVDVVATKHLTTLAYLEPGETWPEMDRWINDPSPWLKRAAIMHQSGMGDFTDVERLFRYCKQQFQKPYQNPELINGAVEFALDRMARTFQVNGTPTGVERTLEFISANFNSMSSEQKKTLGALKATLESTFGYKKQTDEGEKTHTQQRKISTETQSPSGKGKKQTSIAKN